MFPTRPQVEQLAPDASSIKAAGKVSNPSTWAHLASGDEAVWGVCRGSREYQVQVDLRDLASRCSCPSRKFPCKHALGLLFLSATTPPSAGEPPSWVSSWLGKRRKAAAPAAVEEDLTPEEQAAKEAKRAAGRAKRTRARERRVSDGIAALDLWLRDLVREGLSDLDSRPYSFFSNRAQALGDAQATGLRRRVADIAEIPGSSPDWPARVLDRLGQLALLTDAWGREDALPEALRADLRSTIGFSRRTEDTVAHGDLLDGTWLVAGQQVEELELVSSERTWLLHPCGRAGLVIRYARNPGAFGPVLLPGTLVPLTLAFHPSALPQRAVVHERGEGMAPASPEALVGVPGGPLTGPHLDVRHDRIAPFLDRAAACWGLVPWVAEVPAVLRGVTPVRTSDSRWWLVDCDGDGLRLTRGGHWTLLAVSGGRPVDVFGEWDGDHLRPLLVAGEHGLRRLDTDAL